MGGLKSFTPSCHRVFCRSISWGPWTRNAPKCRLEMPSRNARNGFRVFLAGCSPAEPASASSIHSAYQSFYVRSVSGPPAGPCVFGDCVREFRFPIHPTVCFEVGRFTITQSSWTTPEQRCSRKWMSGHAAIALVLLRDRGQFATLTIRPPGEPIPPSQGESPFTLDFLPIMDVPETQLLLMPDGRGVCLQAAAGCGGASNLEPAR
jgi:hypothetical protein